MMRLLKYLVFYILYIVLLCFCYNQYVSAIYGYSGFYLYPSNTSFWVSLVLLIASFFFVYKQKTDTYSKLIVYILFLVNYIPSVILFYYMPIEVKYILLQTLYWIVTIFCVNIANKIKSGKDKQISVGEGIKDNKVLYIIVSVELFVAIIAICYTGINTNFDSVYQLRENFLSTNLPKILLYLFAASKVVNPVLYIYLRKHGKVAWSFVALIVQILLFLCDGSKATLFSIAIAIIIASSKKYRKEYNYLKDNNFSTFLLGGLVTINVVGLLEFIVVKSSYIYNYFIRRLFFVPAFLHMKYYDFFSGNSIDFFRQSIFGKIGIESPYSMPIQNIIGLRYFNDSTLIANNGLFSDAYANLGVIGMIIMPILLVIALRLLDVSAKNIKPLYIVTILISVSYTFLSSSFFTVLLTHGFIILCIILKFVIPKEKTNDEKE